MNTRRQAALVRQVEKVKRDLVVLDDLRSDNGPIALAPFNAASVPVNQAVVGLRPTG